MLAKPEYLSPQDEVCCWPGRSGGAAGRECHGEEDGGTVAESHREDVAGRERCGRDGAKRKSERKSLPLRRRRCDAADAQKTLQCSRCTEAAAMQQMHRRRCDAANAQKTLRWAPERNGELAPIVGTEKATRHRGL